eukprot:6793557-Prymnesium_polylepis.1
MDNILKAFDKCLASIVTTEQVRRESSSERCANAVRAPSRLHGAFTACRSRSHAACRGQRAAGFHAER